MSPDLEKLRRFALAIGLVLITYSLAAVELDVGETIHPLGIPLRINDPKSLGIGLMLVSLYAGVSFVMYGTWLTESPTHKRRMYRYYDPQDPYLVRSGEERQRFEERFSALFPRIRGSEAKVNVTWASNVDDKSDVLEVEGFLIPKIVDRAARLDELNYFAPIWVNVLAVVLWLYRVFVDY